MTTALDIERRLRLPAPDEPATLPPLLLPTDTDSVGATVAIRWRLPVLRGQDARLVYAVALLLLALAAVVAVGALRQRDSTLTPLGLACQRDQGPVFGVNCASVEIPEGWTTLASGQIMPGDFNEQHLGYEIVQLVIASVPLGDCPTTPGLFPTPFESGSVSEMPLPTPDGGLACLRNAALSPDAVRIEALQGQRISGVNEQGLGIPDTSEPSAEAGWTERIAGQPARLEVRSSDGAGGEPAETWTWDVIVPGTIDSVLRIRADIAGPDLPAGRETAQRFVNSLEYAVDPPPLREDEADEVLQSVLDYLERMAAREFRTDYYGCFPRKSGRADKTIRGGPAVMLSAPIDVSCSSAISPSVAGVWRIVLETTWQATSSFEAGGIRTEYFVVEPIHGEATAFFSGGFTVPIGEGEGSPSENGLGYWFPNSEQELPAPLAGSLNLAPGSLVAMLPPGESPSSLGEPDGSSGYPAMVGQRLYVVAGPKVVDGEEWYQVQWDGWNSAAFAWVRGTRDGRPQLEVVEADCPADHATPTALSWLTSAERLLCFGGREVTIEGGVIERGEAVPQVPDLCQVGERLAACPAEPGHPAWLVAATFWQLYGERGSNGPVLGVPIWLAPGVADPPQGDQLRVVGHFDDPTAIGCRFGGEGVSGFLPEPPEMAELLCRQRFVVTGFETR